jgi:predicted nucleotide-binding protein (sugar kinase/HSP70/actin superfamily)
LIRPSLLFIQLGQHILVIVYDTTHDKSIKGKYNISYITTNSIIKMKYNYFTWIQKNLTKESEANCWVR